MPETSKAELLRENAKQAIDAIVRDLELDDDVKEEILEEIQEHVEDGMRILSDEDEDDEDEDEDDEDGDE